MRIFCSGIGGIGLSAYAALQKAAGHDVSGSDRSESVVIEDLRKQWIDVSIGQDGSLITEDIELFVYSEAIPSDAPERSKASELGIRQISYFEALGEISKDHFVIAVCGTHGKSSTTAMAARVLIDAGKDPTVVVGTLTQDLGGRNWRQGESEIFLLEACEYRRNFRFLKPNLVLLTNVDGDHLDAFDGIEDYQKAFVEFLGILPDDGKVVTHGSDPDCVRVIKESGRGLVDADQINLPELQVPGRHMQENAQLVLGMAEALGLPETDSREALLQYSGSWRRMEVKGTYGDGVTVLDDYAHHPKEISSVLRATKAAYPGRRIVAVFQPHTHDRTLTFYDDFCACFSNADQVVITNIYDARSDIETDTVDQAKFVADIESASGVPVTDGLSLTQSERLLREEILKPNDVLLIMGAGDITEMGSALVA